MADVARKALTDLPVLTSTADTDLLHINSGETDYQETKLDFLKGSFGMTWADNVNVTTQADNLTQAGTFIGSLPSYGHQAETGVPVNSTYYMMVQRSGGTNMIIYLVRVATGETWFKLKSSGTWQASWTKLPTRDEMPPDFSSYTSESLTNGTATQITSTGAWYAVRSINTSTSGDCSSYILDSSNVNYLSAVSAPSGTFVRSMTPWLYFPSGKKFYVRSIFASSGGTGELLKASSIS